MDRRRDRPRRDDFSSRGDPDVTGWRAGSFPRPMFRDHSIFAGPSAEGVLLMDESEPAATTAVVPEQQTSAQQETVAAISPSRTLLGGWWSWGRRLVDELAWRRLQVPADRIARERPGCQAAPSQCLKGEPHLEGAQRRGQGANAGQGVHPRVRTRMAHAFGARLAALILPARLYAP